MKRKWNAYTVSVSSDYYVVKKSDDGTTTLEWAEDCPDLHMLSDNGKYERKESVTFHTFAKALEYAQKHQDWNCVTIADECCGEVLQNILIYNRCKCCGHEVYDSFYSDTHHNTRTASYHLPERS